MIDEPKTPGPMAETDLIALDGASGVCMDGPPGPAPGRVDFQFYEPVHCIGYKVGLEATAMIKHHKTAIGSEPVLADVTSESSLFGAGPCVYVSHQVEARQDAVDRLADLSEHARRAGRIELSNHFLLKAWVAYDEEPCSFV